jgi:hypothetical protein
MLTDRLAIFKALRDVLSPYVPPLEAISDFEGRYELVSNKQVVIDGRKRNEVYFSAIIIQGKYVGFYSMTVYANGFGASLPDDLRKILKGKSCFHVKKLDENLLAQFTELTRQSFEFYQQQGWI